MIWRQRVIEGAVSLWRDGGAATRPGGRCTSAWRDSTFVMRHSRLAYVAREIRRS
jgi:hypothetical protein